MDLKFIYFSIYNVLFCLSELSLSPPLCAAVCCNTQQHTHTHRAPPPNSQSPSPPSGSTSYMSPVTVIVSLFFFFLIHAPIALITNSPSPSPSSLPPPPRHGPDHAADDHQQRRLQLPRSLFDPGSTTGAVRTRVDREQAAAAHQTAGSATEPKIRHCHHHHSTTQITPQMTTNGADCSSHGRYSISQWCCRDWPCPSRPRAGRCDPPGSRKCHGAENPALPPPPRHDPDHAADDHQWHRL